MKQKKGLIAVLLGILILFNLVNLVIILQAAEEVIVDITGQATTAQGAISICIGKEPRITAIADQTATVSSAFTYQVNVSTATSLSNRTFHDNTSLFDINQSGYISFTPSSAGTHTISIIAEDVFQCIEINATTTFLLTISGTSSETLEPTPGEGGAGGGGGGGGGGKPAREAAPSLIGEGLPLKITPQTVKATIKENHDSTVTVVIENYGDVSLDISIDDIPSFADIAPTSFTLEPGQRQQLTIVLQAEKGVHTGTATISAGDLVEFLSFILQVESEIVSLDIDDLQLENEKLSSGATSLKATMTFKGVEGIDRAKLIYSIIDLQGQEYYTQEEDISLEGIVSLTRDFNFGSLPDGKYILAVKIISGESFASNIQEFIIGNPDLGLGSLAGSAYAIGDSKIIIGFAILIIVIVLVIIIVALLFLHRRTKKHALIHESTRGKGKMDGRQPQPKTIIKQRTIVQQKTIIKQPIIAAPSPDPAKIRHKLSILEEGYHRGFIKDKAYEQSKQQLLRLLGKK